MRRPNFGNLKEHIFPLSEEKSDFNLAKLEWKLDHIVITTDFGQCPCSQPIKEHCFIKNKKNGNVTHVGNICVKRFMEIDARKLFNGLRKIRNNPEAPPNRDLIEYAFRRGHLYGDNEYTFLRNVVNKRRLSEKQKQWLHFINRRILEKIVVKKLPGQNDLDDIDNVIVLYDQGDNEIEYESDQNGSGDDYDQQTDNDMTSDSGNDSDYQLDENEIEESDDDMETAEASTSDSDSENDSENSYDFEMSEEERANEALRNSEDDDEISDENDERTDNESAHTNDSDSDDHTFTDSDSDND